MNDAMPDFIERDAPEPGGGRTIYMRHADTLVHMRTGDGRKVTAFPTFWNDGTMKFVVEISEPGKDYSLDGVHYTLDLRAFAKWAIANEGLQFAPPTMADMRGS